MGFKTRVALLFGGSLSLSQQAALAREAEEVGFDSLWTGEFWRSSMVPLAALAPATKRVRLGTCVALAFPRSPFLTALTALDLDELSGGRFILGLGSSPRRIAEEWHGAPYLPPGPRLREYVELLRELWDHWQQRPGQPFEFDGHFYRVRFQGYRRVPPPLRTRIPIYMAAVDKTMIKTAGAVADGLLGHPLHSRSYMARVVRPALEEGAREAGRTPQEVELCTLVVTAVHRDRRRAYWMAALGLARGSFTRTYKRVTRSLGLGEAGEALRSAYLRGDVEGMVEAMRPEFVEEAALFGTPEEVREGLRTYDGLVDTVILHPPIDGLEAGEVLENYRLILEAFRDG